MVVGKILSYIKTHGVKYIKSNAMLGPGEIIGGSRFNALRFISDDVRQNRLIIGSNDGLETSI